MKSLLLHSCCAPCLTAVYEKLKDDFDVTAFWFNPNIYPYEEYEKRLKEFARYSEEKGIKYIIGDDFLNDNLNWFKVTEKYSSEKEGGKRCQNCIRYRLLATADYARRNGFDLFATTLSVSPHKNTGMINNTGQEVVSRFENLEFLAKDFKKERGYARSIELSKESGLYRQDYCGCQYSVRNSSSK